MIRGSTLDLQRDREPSRLFDDGNTEYASINVAAITGYPFTMACWFYADDATIRGSLMWVGDKDATNYWTALELRGDVGTTVDAFSHEYIGGSGSAAAQSIATFSVNTWHHAIGEWPDANARASGVDGANRGTDANAVGAMSAHDRTAIGMHRDSSPSRPFSGRIFWSCIWDVILTAAEWAVLGNRSNPTPPWEIRPASIVSMPNMRTLWDPYMRALWTPTGTRPANPPWLWRPRHVSMYVPPVGTIAKHVIQAHRRAG